MKNIDTRLDWSRLLGFDQVDTSFRSAPELATPGLAKVGDKTPGIATLPRSDTLAAIAGKVSFKPTSPSLGSKVGIKPSDPALARLGSKIGSKDSIIRQTRR